MRPTPPRLLAMFAVVFLPFCTKTSLDTENANFPNKISRDLLNLMSALISKNSKSDLTQGEVRIELGNAFKQIEPNYKGKAHAQIIANTQALMAYIKGEGKPEIWPLAAKVDVPGGVYILTVNRDLEPVTLNSAEGVNAWIRIQSIADFHVNSISNLEK